MNFNFEKFWTGKIAMWGHHGGIMTSTLARRIAILKISLLRKIQWSLGIIINHLVFSFRNLNCEFAAQLRTCVVGDVVVLVDGLINVVGHPGQVEQPRRASVDSDQLRKIDPPSIYVQIYVKIFLTCGVAVRSMIATFLLLLLSILKFALWLNISNCGNATYP